MCHSLNLSLRPALLTYDLIRTTLPRNTPSLFMVLYVCIRGHVCVYVCTCMCHECVHEYMGLYVYTPLRHCTLSQVGKSSTTQDSYQNSLLRPTYDPPVCPYILTSGGVPDTVSSKYSRRCATQGGSTVRDTTHEKCMLGIRDGGTNSLRGVQRPLLCPSLSIPRTCR